jgi:phosphomethylpyrimidine kinase
MDSGDAAGVTQRLPIALTIAGSDSGGGAGIQADLKTFAAFGVFAGSVVTALTAQNTRGVRAIHNPPPGIVGAQIEAVLEDFAVAAIKIGMLGSVEIANVVAETLSERSPNSPAGRGSAALLARGEGGSIGRSQERPSRDGLRRRMRAFLQRFARLTDPHPNPLPQAGEGAESPTRPAMSARCWPCR